MKWPRRSSIAHRKPEETAITSAIDMVERMGCDVLLSEAVVLLGQARDKVSDYIDTREPEKAEVEVLLP